MRSALAAYVIIFCTEVLAQTVSDERTGLSVTAPPGFSAVAGDPRGRYAAVVDAKRIGERERV